jgi:integrase
MMSYREHVYNYEEKNLSQMNRAAAKHPKHNLFGNVLDAWLENSRNRWKASSYVKYYNHIQNHIKPALGDCPLSNISSDKLNDFAVKMLKTGKRNANGGLSIKTVRDIMVVIKSALKYASNEDLQIDVNFRLNLPRERIKEIRVLSRNEQVRLEQYLRTNIDLCKLGILLCLYTGLRIGELCALKWADISLGEKTLAVARTMQRMQLLETDSATKTKVVETSPKSDSSARVIPIPDCLLEKLDLFRAKHPAAYFLTGAPNQYIEPRTYQNKFKIYMKEAEIKDVNFHALRHTFATRCIEVGFDVKSLSEILGHANVNITLNRYVHPSMDLKRTNMNKLQYLN